MFNIDTKVGVAGVYIFELNGKQIFEAPSKNLITDFGWNRLSNLSVSALTDTRLQLGTGNTPPALSDTSLSAFLVERAGPATGTVGTATDAGGLYTFSRISYAFAQGAVVGSVAEVGFKVASGDSGLTSRSLVKDGLGNPAVIVVTAIDQLTVSYELRYYRSPVDVTSTVTVAGVPTTYIFRTADIIGGTAQGTGYIGGMGLDAIELDHALPGMVLGAPNAAISGAGTITAYNGAVTGRTVTVNPTSTVVGFSTGTIPTGSGNVSGGVSIMQFSGQYSTGGGGILGAYSRMKASFSPAIPKDSTKTLSYSFSCTFTRL